MTAEYIDERFRHLDTAVAGLADSIKKLDAHMETLISVVIRQEEQAKNITAILAKENELERRIRQNELALASRSGSVAVLRWLTGGSLIAVITLVVMLIGGV